MRKIITVMLVFYTAVVLGLWGAKAWAGGSHPYVPIDLYPEDFTPAPAPAPDLTEGVALGIAAAQCDMDSSTTLIQSCVGFGHYNGNDAGNISIGKRLNNGPLLKGSIGIEGGETGYGAGVTWRW